MDWTENTLIADQLWRVFELLQRVNMLADIDVEDFEANNVRCKHIKEVAHRLYKGDHGALKEARDLAAEYQGIFMDKEKF